MYSQIILKSLKAAEVRPHKPDFSVREEEVGWWLEEGGRPMAFIHRQTFCFDPFEFSPFGTLGRAVQVHPRYDMGTRINMHMTLLVNVLGNFCLPDEALDVQWVERMGRRLVLRLDQRYSGGVRAVTTLTVDYRSERASYGYEFGFEISETVQTRGREFCNFYAKHLGDGIPGQKKWQYTVWQGGDDKLWKFAHNPALDFALRPGSGMPKRLIKGGFIGFGVEEDFNPAVLFLDANVPLLSVSCDCWHDEHLMLDWPGVEYVTGDTGTAQCRVELVNVPQRTMARIAEKAEIIPIGGQEIASKSCPALIWEESCSMNETVDPRSMRTGWVFVPGNDRWVEIGEGCGPDGKPLRHEGAGNRAEWAPGEGRSGGRCLKLSGLEEKVVGWIPAGQVPHVRAGTRYRFEAYVRTTGDAKASIWLGNIWGNIYDFSIEAESELLAANEWKKVAVELTITDYPYIMPRLRVLGEGEAYFDDLWIGPA